jgi:two-component system cell cycle response regulator DivK
MSRTILIVEDNEYNRLLLHDIMVCHGYEVLEAKDGIEGIEIIKAAKPDLVLMDIHMPVMDGVTAAAILKKDPATAGIKLIALTSFAMKRDRERILAAGFDDYITKPINTRKLPLIVRGHLVTNGGTNNGADQ